MKTRNLLAVIGICLTILSSSLVVISLVVVQDNRELRREAASLRADLHHARGDVSQLRDEKTDAAERIKALENELTEAKDPAPKASDDAGATPAVPRAYKIRAYVGNQFLGMGWVVPSARPKDAETGEVTYEPVLVLDESLRRNFVVHRTNVVEREVSRETTVNYNYPYPYWYWSYPVFFLSGTNQLARCATNTPPRIGPRTPQPPIRQPTPKQFPYTKVLTPAERPFLPPLNVVRPAPIKIQANLNANMGGVRRQVIGVSEPQRNVTPPLLPPGS